MAPRGSKNAKGNKGGKGGPAKFKPEYCQVAKTLFEVGGTDADLARALDVSQSTIWRWKSTNPKFMESCKRGAEAADNRVEASFYQRAVGYERKAVKVLSYEGKSWEHEYVEEVPADVNAGRFWLTNRHAERWRDKQTLEHGAPEDSPLAAVARMLANTGLRPKED